MSIVDAKYAIISIVLIAVLFIRWGTSVSRRFWTMQPVLYWGNAWRLIYTPHIISPHLPAENSMVVLDCVTTSKFSPDHADKLNKFIWTHYLPKKDNRFAPSDQQIIPYFKTTTHAPLISWFENKGCITSRPMHVFICLSTLTIEFDVYYVDYLCVHSDHRKSGIAPKLIQTHHYNQRHANPGIKVSVFRREEDWMHGVLPLCSFNTEGFLMSQLICKDKAFISKINRSPGNTLTEFIQTVQKMFSVFMVAEMATLNELICTENILWVTVSREYEIAHFFFRNTGIYVDDVEIISLFASIGENSVHNTPIFSRMFHASLEVLKIIPKQLLAIERVSHNVFINTRTQPIVISPTAYFFYNFSHHPVSAHTLCVLN